MESLKTKLFHGIYIQYPRHNFFESVTKHDTFGIRALLDLCLQGS